LNKYINILILYFIVEDIGTADRILVSTASALLHTVPSFPVPENAQKPCKVLCPEIPMLANYEVKPPDSFWKFFPQNNFPKDITSPIDVNSLEFELAKNSRYFTIHEKIGLKAAFLI
jgi:hypothetical protein